MNPIKMRFYYDSEGQVFFNVNLYGETTVEKDIADFKALSERNRDTFDVLELPFGAYQQDFAEGTLVGVDITTKEPIFSYPDPNAPTEPIIEQIPLSTQINEVKTELSATQTELMVAQEVLDFLLMGGA